MESVEVDQTPITELHLRQCMYVEFFLTRNCEDPECEECHSNIKKHINQKIPMKSVHEELLRESFESRKRNFNRTVVGNSCSEKHTPNVHVQ